jgi:hypothetical protein
MLSLTTLPLLVLGLPALGAFLAGALPTPARLEPGMIARWLVRVSIALGGAGALDLLLRIGPGGTVQVTLWQVGPGLPVTLQFGVAGLLMALLVLGAALLVSFSARDRRPLASSALGLAVVGGLMAALAGGLLGLFIGLQLSAVGGIGLSYARSPRTASHRIIWAAVADQTVALVWLAAVLTIYHTAGTLQFSDIPTGSVNFVSAWILLIPALVRLGSVSLLWWRRGNERAAARSLDVADWLAVAAIPTGLTVLLRDLQLSGGSWPSPSFGTILDLLGLGLALVVGAASLLVWRRHRSGAAVTLTLVALILVGFGTDSPGGVELAVASALFLELLVYFLPRLSSSPAPPWSPTGLRAGILGAWLRLGTLGLVSPLSFGFTAAVLGFELEAPDRSLGLLPAAGYAACLAVLCLALPGLLRLRPPAPGGTGWVLAIPAGLAIAFTVAGGWAVTGVAAAFAFSTTAVTSPLTAPDPLLLQVPGLLYPVGYLAILLGMLLAAAAALRYALGLAPRFWPSQAAESQVEPEPPPGIPALRERLLQMSSSARSALGVLNFGLAMSEREVAERPIWLWMGLTALAAWFMAQR